MTDNLWTFPPNWTQSVTVTPEFRTDIIVSRSGREQRRALRKTPRKTVGFQSTVNRDAMRAFTRLMATAQNQSLTMADPSRRVNVVTADLDTATLATLPPWVVNGAAVLMMAGDRVETRAIATVSGSTVTFSAPSGSAWPAGTVLRPALTGRVSAMQSATALTNNVMSVSVSFAVAPGSEPADEGSPGIYLHAGREVFPFDPNWGSTPTFNFSWATEDVDFGFGRIASYTPLTFGTMIRQATFIHEGVEAITEIQQFHSRMRGQLGEFYVPTGLEDMRVGSGATAGESTVRVLGQVDVDGAIALKLWDGRRIFRTVSSAAPDGSDTILTVSSPWLVDIDPSEVATICRMPVFRLSSDALSIEWLTAEVAQTQISMQSIEDLPPESDVPTYDGAAQWFLEAYGERGLTLLVDPLHFLVNVKYPEVTS